MKIQKKHPQQASAAFMVIFIHAFIIGFIIQWFVPFFWDDTLSTNTNLFNITVSSAIYSFLLALLSSIKVYKTGIVTIKYILRMTLYSVFAIVLAQTIFMFPLSTPEKFTSENIHTFIRTFAFSLITVMVMASISWKIWDKWRLTRTYD